MTLSLSAVAQVPINGFRAAGSGVTQASGITARISTATTRPSRFLSSLLSTDPTLVDRRYCNIFRRNRDGDRLAATAQRRDIRAFAVVSEIACGASLPAVEDPVERAGDDHPAA